MTINLGIVFKELISFLREIPTDISIGQLYGTILEHLGLRSQQVIYMIYNNIILGLQGAQFTANLNSLSMDDNNIVYVVPNHFPSITDSIGHSTIELFNKWYNRQNIEHKHIRGLATNFEPVLSRRELSRQPIINSLSSQPQVNMSTPLQRMPRWISNELADIFSIPDLALMSALGDMYQVVNLNLEDVVVTITEEQFSLFVFGKYVEIINEYKIKYPHEIPYTRCPITHSDFNNESNVVILGCSHYFSYEGIHPWLTTHSVKCPCCNVDVRDYLKKRIQDQKQIINNKDINLDIEIDDYEDKGDDENNSDDENNNDDKNDNTNDIK